MERRLAAIMAADVVGYSRLIRADEEGTIAALKALRADLVDPKLAEHNGRIVKLMGDGMLAEFASVVDAVRAAVETQQAVTDHNSDLPADKRIEFRVGINLGDVVIDGDDIHGDGVNVAARLEGMAEPGGICVSGKVYEEVRDRTDFAFEDLGEREVKNIDRPVRVWRWIAGAPPREDGTAAKALPLPDKPSIAVLPFDNMSGDPEQEYFADGITEDIITALSKFRWFFVSARNSTFSYKGQAIDIKQVGRDLGVRYVLEGSVRKAGDRIRVTAQLIEAETGNHIWADRYDRVLADIFDLQDEMQQAIATAVEPELAGAEYERASRKSPKNLDAWDWCQQALWHMNQRTREDTEKAAPLFEKAISIDPLLARAYAGYARLLINTLGFGWGTDRDELLSRAVSLASEAVRRDDRDSFTHDALGRALAFSGEIDRAIHEHRLALQLNPNSAYTCWALGEMLFVAGQPEEGLQQVERALRLSPRDPLLFLFMSVKGLCLDRLERTVEAERAHRQAISLKPTIFPSYVFLADFYVRHDRLGEAQTIVADALRRIPDLSVAALRDAAAPAVRSLGEDFVPNLVRAGLPE
jgi:adenylate cyclase